MTYEWETPERIEKKKNLMPWFFDWLLHIWIHKVEPYTEFPFHLYQMWTNSIFCVNLFL